MIFTLADQTAMLAAIGTAATLENLGDSVPVTVDFRPENSIVNGVITDRPTARMLGTQLDGVDVKEATLTVAGVDYRLVKPLPSGDGFLIVTLARI